jgi:hypothetical protein
MSRTPACIVLVFAVLALSACDKAAHESPTTVPGSPGQGNPPEVIAPAAPDTPPGGSSGMKGSVPVPGTSGGGAPVGTTGRGTSEPGARSQSAQPGVGTAGGLAGNSGLGMTGSFPPEGSSTQAGDRSGGVAPPGSPNSTRGSSVGNR